MLPFEKDNHVRKYTCFVCGVAFTEFKEYKEHVLDSHDEGREFVVCPLQRCQAPVRCLRTHFAHKHRGEPVPKSGQLRATIWKDIRAKDGKLQNRKPKFKEGYLTSAKNGGKQMHYRSGMECEVYECLESMPDVVSYSVEPFAVQYTFRGDVHHYNPDLSVVFLDGRTEIWEIKPSRQTHLAKNQAKWAACNQYCESRGYGFMVLTEVGMGKLKKQIKSQSS